MKNNELKSRIDENEVCRLYTDNGKLKCKFPEDWTLTQIRNWQKEMWYNIRCEKIESQDSRNWDIHEWIRYTPMEEIEELFTDFSSVEIED